MTPALAPATGKVLMNRWGGIYINAGAAPAKIQAFDQGTPPHEHIEHIHVPFKCFLVLDINVNVEPMSQNLNSSSTETGHWRCF